MTNNLSIIQYEDQYAEDFYRLNVAWLEKYFYVEDIDRKVLSQPEQYIIEPGGMIFLARYNYAIVGTAALIAQPEGRFELSKMAVDESVQGLGIGKMLALAAIDAFNASGRSELYLESNRRLKTALNLYRKVGFVETAHPQENSHYERADIYMVYRRSGI